MLSFFRDGFYKDFIVLVLVTILLGTLFSAGIAWALDAYFGDTLTDMIGEYGQYDIILHIQEESKEAAFRELERLRDQQFPGARLSETITIAGQANFFFGLPDEFRTKEVMANLPSYFAAVPGLNSHTIISDPSILIRGVHGSVSDELAQKIEELPGVRFTFTDMGNMIVLLEDPILAKALEEDIKEILGEYQLVELRFPMGFEVDTAQVGEEAIRLLEQELPGRKYRNVTAAQYGEDLNAFLKTLVEMRDFLLSYASKVRITADPEVYLIVGEQIAIQGQGAELAEGGMLTEGNVVIEITAVNGDQAEGMIIRGEIAPAMESLHQGGYRVFSDGQVARPIGQVEVENERYRLAYAIDESLRLLEELEVLSVQATDAVQNADAVLNTFQEALLQLEVLQAQMRQLNQGISGKDSTSSSEQLLVSLLINGLFQSLAQAAVQAGEDNLDSLENLDIAAMRASLDQISDQIANVQDIDVQAIINQIEYVRETLPMLGDEDIGRSIRLINTYIAGQVIPGERIQIMVENGQVDEGQVETVLRRSLDNPYLNIYSTSVGVINPDARSEIFRLLTEVRAIIAGLLAIVFTGAILMLDHAVVFSTLKYLRRAGRAKRLRWQVLNPVLLFGGLLGAVILTSVYRLSGAEIPYLSLGSIVLIGGLVGWVVARFAERFSPVNIKEVTAGQALGLSNVQIMREIVIPSSRPGLMNLLNRWKQQFRG
jgi:DNA-binding protein YbaB